jgi:hypothetical protein
MTLMFPAAEEVLWVQSEELVYGARIGYFDRTINPYHQVVLVQPVDFVPLLFIKLGNHERMGVVCIVHFGRMRGLVGVIGERIKCPHATIT